MEELLLQTQPPERLTLAAGVAVKVTIIRMEPPEALAWSLLDTKHHLPGFSFLLGLGSGLVQQV
jgi:hypothetical protein